MTNDEQRAGTETLQLASDRIRHDVQFGQAHGDERFLLAVAVLLEDAADALDLNTPTGEAALDLARAYLGESA